MTGHVELVRSSELAAAPYAHAAIVHNATTVVFTAGACPLDAEGGVVGIGDVTRQAQEAIQNLEHALAAAHATIADVVKTTVYVASSDRGDLVAVWDVVAAAFGDHDVPSTLVGVAVLGYRDQLVEIEAIATLS